jgi:hypothetical protein
MPRAHADTHRPDETDTWMELRLVTVHGDQVLAQSLLWVGDWLTPQRFRQLADSWSGSWPTEQAHRRKD